MKKLCVFDLDGTLVNSIYDIADAMNFALTQIGRGTYETEMYYQMVGNGMKKLCENALKGATEDLDALMEIYKERYITHCCEKTAVYPGVEKLLKNLKSKGIQIAVLTNKPQSQTDVILKKLLPDTDFVEVLGQSDRFPVKPDPKGLYAIMEKAGANKNNTIHIGDSNVDMQLGKSAGVSTIGVTWGFRSRQELEENGATYLADMAEDVEKIIDSCL